MKQINQAFEQFYQRIVPDTYALSQIEASKRKIQNIFKNNLTREETPLFVRISGSYKRKTMSGTTFDLDVVVVFDSEFARNLGPKSLMETVSASLNANNIRSEPMIHAVKAKINNNHVDIVPAHPSPYYSENKVLLIPELLPQKKPQWVKTNPSKNEEILTKYNNLYEKKLIPTIRMLKVWNKNETKCYFSSFHLESIILEIFRLQNMKNKSYFDAMVKIFQTLPRYIEKKISEPACVGPELYVPVEKRDCLKKRTRKALTGFERAFAYSRSNESRLAIEELRKVFGAIFPQI